MSSPAGSTTAKRIPRPHTGPMARWTRILEAFAQQGDWGSRDLAGTTGIPRSATHRILHDMVRLGLLAPAEKRGRFQIGPGLARMSMLIAAELDIRRLGRPILERLAAELGETVVLTIYDPQRRQFSAVDAAETNHPIRYIWGSLREWSDLYLGASGKGILAFLPDAEMEEIIGALPDPVPGRLEVSRSALRRELAAVRQRGYAVSHGERYEGAVGVSAPFRDALSRVCGDLIATWPDNRTTEQKEAAAGLLIRAGAGDLSRRLGWTEAPATTAEAADE